MSALPTEFGPLVQRLFASARVHLQELETAGLASEGRLTDAGKAALLASQYGIYATALRRNRQ